MSRHETQALSHYACFVTKVTQTTVRGRPYLERSLDECQIFAAPLKITTERTFFVSNESTRAGTIHGSRVIFVTRTVVIYVQKCYSLR